MTWLDHYLNYSTVNESPCAYHLWSGLSLMAALTGRRVWTDENLYQVYPNLYVVLAGPPGVAKSTAMRVARDFVRTNNSNLPICASAISKESLVETMATEKLCQHQFNHENVVHKFSQMNVFGDELVSLLSCGGNPTGMIEFVTEMFDTSLYDESTKNKGKNKIFNPYLNILTCCTIETLKQLVANKVVSGGASRRFVFVVERKGSKPIARIHFTEDQLASKAFCAANWSRFQAQTGKFTWSDEADRFYSTWYDENFDRKQRATSPTLQHFLQTKPSYCMKVSMLLALADEQPLVHTMETFKTAVDLVTRVEDGASRLFDNDGINPMAAIIDDLEVFIFNQPEERLHIKKIYQAFFSQCRNNDTREIDAVIQQLVRMDKVKLEPAYEGQSIVNYVAKIKKP